MLVKSWDRVFTCPHRFKSTLGKSPLSQLTLFASGRPLLSTRPVTCVCWTLIRELRWGGLRTAMAQASTGARVLESGCLD